jgi:hypothetical protein
VSYIALSKYQQSRESFGSKLAQNMMLADQYAAYRQYIHHESILQIEGYPLWRVISLELLNDTETAFGNNPLKLGEVARKLLAVEKNSPFALAAQNQQQVIGFLQASSPKEAAGQEFTKPAQSPRYLITQA